MQSLKKNPLIGAIILIAIYLALKAYFWPMQKNIDVTILKPNQSIQDLNHFGKIIDQKQFAFDHLSFPLGEELFHQNTGYLGYRQDFLLHARTELNVLQEGNYTFIVDSDDGFSLTLNQQPICEHIDGRAMQSSVCEVFLSKGKQFFELKYFQGFGKLGLRVSYETESEQNFVVGKDSAFITFTSPVQVN